MVTIYQTDKTKFKNKIKMKTRQNAGFLQVEMREGVSKPLFKELCVAV